MIPASFVLPRPLRPLVLLLAAVLLILLTALPSSAQNEGAQGPDFARWEALADRAEAALGDRATPEARLVELRAEVVAFRAQLSEVQVSNGDGIAILREQIEALGPPPTEGEVEAPEIAERRADLNARLANRQAPMLAADEAFRRADAIIRSIDRQLRERQAEALTRLWPTPLNPANWTQGVDALTSSVLTVWGEAYNSWLDPRVQADFWSNLPLGLAALAAALGLLLRGRRWVEGLTLRLLQSTTILRGRVVAAFFLSLTQIIVPLAGLYLLTLSVQMTGLQGETIAALTDAVFRGGVAVILARWLSLQIFPRFEDPGLNLRLDEWARRRARGLALGLALLVALTFLIEALIQPDQQSDAAVAVLLFPLIVVTGLFLLRLARVLRSHAPASGSADEGGRAAPTFVDRTIWTGAKLLLGLAILAPLLAAVGYVGGARQIIYPAIYSLGLISLVIVLHRLITAIYEAALGVDEGTSDALVPALAGFLLTLAAIPVLALLWGVRMTELLEVWQRFQEGFRLGETRIAPGNILSFFIVFGIGYVLTRGIQGALSSSVLPKTTMERGAQKAVASGLGYVGIFVAALIAFSTAGIDLSGLAIVAGALSVGIGFGLQNIVSNFVSGVILLIERPVSEGDWVQVGTTQGFVTRISVRSTVIETFDKSEVIVPNTDLISGTVTNYTKTNRTGRLIVAVSVAYGTDTRRVEAILREIAESNPIVAVDPPPGIVFTNFGADGLEFEMRMILRDVSFIVRVANETRHEIAQRFRDEGIEIPFAQRDIWLRNPEALTGARPAPGAQPAGMAASAASSAPAALTSDATREPFHIDTEMEQTGSDDSRAGEPDSTRD